MKKMLFAFAAVLFCAALCAEEITGQTRFVPGLRLQLWTNVANWDLRKLNETFYQKDAAGGMIDRGALFCSKSVLNSPMLKSYVERGGTDIYTGWDGYLKITKAGEHVFTFVPGKNSYTVFLNDKQYAVSNHRTGFGESSVKSFNLDLEPGLYQFACVIHVNSWDLKALERHTVSATVKEPGALEPRALTVKDFVVPEEWTRGMRR